MSTNVAEKKPETTIRVRKLPDDPTSVGVVARFGRGLKLALGGFGLVFSDATLLGLSIIPMVVHAALLAALLVAGAAWVVDPMTAWLAPETTSTTTDVAMAVGRTVWAVAVVVLVWVLVVGLSLVGALVAGSIICDPFYDALSERTEALHLGRDVGVPFSVAGALQGIVRELTATMLRLVVYATVAIPLWGLAFTPLGVVATPLGLVWTWLFFAYEFLARPMMRHVDGATGRFRVLFAHKALFTGFGAVAWLTSFVPLTAPLLIVAATRLYLTLAADGAAPTTLPADDVARLRARAIAP
jgi:uncharacterized protein involved in cysteine biosynthesis